MAAPAPVVIVREAGRVPKGWTMLTQPAAFARACLAVALLTVQGACGGDHSPDVAADRLGVVEGSSGVCADCRLVLSDTMIVGKADGEGALESDFVVARADSTGRIYIFTTFGSTIDVYDPAGSFITRVGRAGGGLGSTR